MAILIISVSGGWLLSRAREESGAVDAVLTLTPGSTSQDPTIGTNAPNAGKRWPVLELLNLDDSPVSVRPAEGKVMLVNFWFSTCEPCKREIPALVAAHAKYDVDIFGINPRDSADAARNFADQFEVDYEVLRDPDGTYLTKLGVGTFPITYLVDGAGTIVEQHAGEVTEADLDRMLGTAVGNK